MLQHLAKQPYTRTAEMESFDVKIKVFKNTPDDKKTLHTIIQEFIHSNDDKCEIAVVRTRAGQVGPPILKEFFNNLGFHIDCNGSAEENLSRKDLLERAGNTMSTSSPAVMPEITFRLYNCDRTYNLDRVEALITKVTTKLSLKAKIEQKYFSLPKMSELCEKLEEEGKQPGYAVFVVHAHEARLVINTNNEGYSMLYRTLLRLTDGRVLIVVGGDDNYKDQEERDKVLSRWVCNKIRAQFREDYLNGKKSFIFSWEDNHHPIHEEALEFYLNPKKKGQEFVPRPRPAPVTVPTQELFPIKKDPPVPKDDEKEKGIPDPTGQQPVHSQKPSSKHRSGISSNNEEMPMPSDSIYEIPRLPLEAETHDEKGRLRYRARIKRGQVHKVQKSDPLGWKPEETMIKQLLDKHEKIHEGCLEFWQNEYGKIMAVVIDDQHPLTRMIVPIVRSGAAVKKIFSSSK